MAFPDNVLANDEQVVRQLHPHWKTIITPFFWLVVIVAAAGAGITFLSNSTVRLVIVGIAALLLCWLTLYPLLRWVCTRYVFTTHRVIIRLGVLNRSGRDVPLGRINDVSFERTFIERMLGAGTLVVESAGEHGQLVLKDIAHVQRVQSTLYQLVERDADRRQSEQHGYSGGGFHPRPGGPLPSNSQGW